MSLVPISFGSAGRPPIVLVHDISGSAFPYIPFALDATLKQHTIYGISALKSNNSSFGFESVSAWAESYANLLDELKEKRVILGGWSLGGVLAMEMARILAKRGRFQVLGVVCIDSHAPWHTSALPLRTVPQGVEVGGRLVESAYFTPSEMSRLVDLWTGTTREELAAAGKLQCSSWLITPAASGCNGLEDWFGEHPERVLRVGQEGEGCDHFSMMEAKGRWIPEVVLAVKDVVRQLP
ncbi:Alpha/Beta hydrolase protein [Roridomyces roridus]|uniref:Alpha/Beta hydrolase protein n=1 Tax=Roridomyces roridus TaxID=1738132 RepID=A0AAD7C4Z5_9AGAR|nr:Alpha/Beta hydrolase protein [Roridomyces roridus]